MRGNSPKPKRETIKEETAMMMGQGPQMDGKQMARHQALKSLLDMIIDQYILPQDQAGVAEDPAAAAAVEELPAAEDEMMVDEEEEILTDEDSIEDDEYKRDYGVGEEKPEDMMMSISKLGSMQMPEQDEEEDVVDSELARASRRMKGRRR
jgi:hypothetical protein